MALVCLMCCAFCPHPFVFYCVDPSALAVSPWLVRPSPALIALPSWAGIGSQRSLLWAHASSTDVTDLVLRHTGTGHTGQRRPSPAEAEESAVALQWHGCRQARLPPARAAVTALAAHPRLSTVVLGGTFDAVHVLGCE